MELTQLPHMLLINRAGIKFKDFDQHAKNEIESIKMAHRGWSIHKKPQGIQPLISRSQVLAQYIYNLFVEHEDQQGNVQTPDGITTAADDIKGQISGQQPTQSNIPSAIATTDNTSIQVPGPTTQSQNSPSAQSNTSLSKDEQALHNLYNVGVTSGITVDMLKQQGFNTNFWTTRLTTSGCTIGRYSLVRDSDKRSVYNLFFRG